MKSCLVFLVFILLVGCEGDNEISQKTKTYFPTIKEAIEEGLIHESGKNKRILTQKIINNETIILFWADNAIGSASISELNKSFSWYRSSPLTSLEKNENRKSVYKKDDITENGTKYSILLGYVPEKAYNQVSIEVNGEIKVLQIDKSRYFYYLTSEINDFSLVELLE